MPIYAVVDSSGNITNRIVLDDGSNWPTPEGCTLVQSDKYEIGGTLIKGVYTPPVPTVTIPQSVSAMQAKVALSRAGLLVPVQTWMAQQNAETQLIWNTATTFDRGSALISSAAGALGLSASQIDQLFIAAGGINP